MLNSNPLKSCTVQGWYSDAHGWIGGGGVPEPMVWAVAKAERNTSMHGKRDGEFSRTGWALWPPGACRHLQDRNVCAAKSALERSLVRVGAGVKAEEPFTTESAKEY